VVLVGFRYKEYQETRSAKYTKKISKHMSINAHLAHQVKWINKPNNQNQNSSINI
jgi:hypothetical protein